MRSKIPLLFSFLIALVCAFPAHAANPFAAGQVWKGSYECRQGETKLTVRVNKVAKAPVKSELGEAIAIEAFFDFDYNNREAAGAFRVAGNFYPESRVATLDPKSWIRQPVGFEMVGMDGVVSENGRDYKGKILFSGCSSFEVQLQNP